MPAGSCHDNLRSRGITLPPMHIAESHETAVYQRRFFLTPEPIEKTCLYGTNRRISINQNLLRLVLPP